MNKILKNDKPNEEILYIPHEHIYMRFSLENQDYIAFSSDSDDVGELNIMFAKIIHDDEFDIATSISDTSEYRMVANEFAQRLKRFNEM